MFVEQAIFTSLKTRRQEGYQLASVSLGVSSELAKELEVWGPAHDSLLDGALGASSVNFHPLTSGEYCVSRTIAAGEEYSGRGGPRIYTQMLIVPPDVLLRFANNPFAVLEAAEASGQMPVHDQPPSQLAPVRLLGRASSVNLLRLAELTTDPGVDKLLLLLQFAVESPAIATLSPIPLARLYAGLFSLLPLSARLQFSLSTGLRYSQRRPVRMLALPADTTEQRNLQRSSGAIPLDCTTVVQKSAGQLRGGWAQLISDLFQTGQVRALAQVLRRAELVDDGTLSLDQLAASIGADLPAMLDQPVMRLVRPPSMTMVSPVM